ncbi:MAG: hypothetical protein QMD71_06570 [bacterium]|nr:hypothetical protein [bacterium]
MIKGNLYAIGTAMDSIIISARDTTQRWSRLWFKPSSRCSLKYCRIEYAGNSAIYDSIAFSLYIGYNTITNNYALYGSGIRSYGSPTIKYNTITDTIASAIYISSDSALIDSNNLYATGYAVYNYSEIDIDARYNYWGQ